MQEQLERDLKAALLSGNRQKSETLKMIKSALQYEAVSLNTRDNLPEEVTQKVLAREAKKRAETAELYKKAGENARAETELAEKAIIDAYLPERLPEEDVLKVVKEELAKLDNPGPADTGKIIGAVRAKLGSGADGSVIAKLVRQSLESK